jgi:hypothetical protein
VQVVLEEPVVVLLVLRALLHFGQNHAPVA